MFKAIVVFASLLTTVIGLVNSENADARQPQHYAVSADMSRPPQPQAFSATANTQVSNVLQRSNQNCDKCKSGETVTISEQDWVTCRPGGSQSSPPGFYAPPSQQPPASVVPMSPPSSDDSTKMGLGAIIGLVIMVAVGVAGVFIRKRIEDTADEKEAELKEAKEKVWREKAIKLAASKHVPNV